MKNRFLVRVALFLFVMMGVVSGLPPVVIQASAMNPAITITNVNSGDANAGSGGKIFEACNTINERFKTEVWADDNPAPKFIECAYDDNSNSCTLTINMTRYKKLKNELQQKAMQIALDEIYNSQISRTAKNKIYNEICALDETTSALVRELSNDVRADFVKAYGWFKPWSGPLGIALGVISLAMFVTLGFTVVVDIAYITIPVLQLWLTDEANNRAKLVSHEAYSAVKEQQSKAGVEYKSPMMLYLRAKTVQFIAIFICLLYLVSGQLYVLLANMMDYFRGVLG